MKRLFMFYCLALSVFAPVQAQDKSYRAVFDLTSGDTLDQKAVMCGVGEISAENPGAQLEMVMCGKGFELVMPGGIEEQQRRQQPHHGGWASSIPPGPSWDNGRGCEGDSPDLLVR